MTGEISSKRFRIDAGDGAALCACRWDSEQPPRAVIQLAHGAAEHVGRYGRFARFLNQCGYTVLGADHRGHGINIPHGVGVFGPRGFAGLVKDMATVAEAAKRQFPSIPVVLFGHSMGSFASQAFLAEFPDLIDGLILSGTAAVDELLAEGTVDAGFEALNAAFEPSRTAFDWLSRDEMEVDAYIADPLCGIELEIKSLATMPEVLAGVRSPERLAGAVKRQIPVYVISGEFDPLVGPGQRSARTVVDNYAMAGLQDISHRVYPGGRHEMLNETNRDEVMGDIAQWLMERF